MICMMYDMHECVSLSLWIGSDKHDIFTSWHCEHLAHYLLGCCRPCCISPWIPWTDPAAPRTPARQIVIGQSTQNQQRSYPQPQVHADSSGSIIYSCTVCSPCQRDDDSLTSRGWLGISSITLLVSSVWRSADETKPNVFNECRTFVALQLKLHENKICRTVFAWFIIVFL